MGSATEADRGETKDPLVPFSARWDAMVLMLTWAAGSVDAISYLGLDHVFTANMTGNTVLLGLAIGQGQGLAALRSLIALAGFACGAAIGAAIVESGPKQSDWPPGVTRAVVVEGMILGIFSITWHLPGKAHSAGLVYVLIALSAVAMGMQSAAIRHLNVPGVATTYITGTLTSFVAGFVGWLGPADVRSATTKPADKSAAAGSPTKRQSARLQAAVFFIYGLAAVASGVLQARLSMFVTLSPLIAVVLVVVNATIRHRSERHASQ